MFAPSLYSLYSLYLCSLHWRPVARPTYPPKQPEKGPEKGRCFGAPAARPPTSDPPKNETIMVTKKAGVRSGGRAAGAPKHRPFSGPSLPSALRHRRLRRARSAVCLLFAVAEEKGRVGRGREAPPLMTGRRRRLRRRPGILHGGFYWGAEPPNAEPPNPQSQQYATQKNQSMGFFWCFWRFILIHSCPVWTESRSCTFTRGAGRSHAPQGNPAGKT